MRIVLMVSKISAGNSYVVLTGVWLAPCHYGGGGSTPSSCALQCTWAGSVNGSTQGCDP